jgi:hypothetical protein
MKRFWAALVYLWKHPPDICTPPECSCKCGHPRTSSGDTGPR